MNVNKEYAQKLKTGIGVGKNTHTEKGKSPQNYERFHLVDKPERLIVRYKAKVQDEIMCESLFDTCSKYIKKIDDKKGDI